MQRQLRQHNNSDLIDQLIAAEDFPAIHDILFKCSDKTSVQVIRELKKTRNRKIGK
jgi:hypothetical protein